MSLKRTTGVIIKVTDYGESDRIITLYCPREGKLTAIAKGANRSKKRFMNKLELFTHLEIHYNNRYKLALLDQAEPINSFTNLRGCLKRYAAAGLVCELLLHWSQENDGDKSIFSALLHTLLLLDDSRPVKKTIVLFLIHLYSRLGYQPDLTTCIKCGSLSYYNSPFQFKVRSGSVVCSKCTPTSSLSIPLSLTTMKFVTQAQKMPFEKTVRLQFTAGSIREILYLFKHYGSYLLDRQLNSWAFLDKIDSQKEIA